MRSFFNDVLTDCDMFRDFLRFPLCLCAFSTFPCVSCVFFWKLFTILFFYFLFLLFPSALVEGNNPSKVLILETSLWNAEAMSHALTLFSS